MCDTNWRSCSLEHSLERAFAGHTTCMAMLLPHAAPYHSASVWCTTVASLLGAPCAISDDATKHLYHAACTVRTMFTTNTNVRTSMQSHAVQCPTQPHSLWLCGLVGKIEEVSTERTKYRAHYNIALHMHAPPCSNTSHCSCIYGCAY